jgi:hypothetical protein
MNRESTGKLSTAEDRFAIQDVYYLCAYLLDSGNAIRCPEEIFTADAVVNYGGANDIVGRQALIEAFAGVPTSLEATSHNITNIAVRVDGDRASGVARVMGWHWLQSNKHLGPNRPVDFLQVAGYADEFRREHGRWWIAKRIVHALGPGNLGLGVGVLPPWPSSAPHLREVRWPF